MPVAVENIFGDRTWDDLRSVVLTHLRRRYPHISVETCEDAVSEAIGDLLMGWVYCPGSIIPDDPELTWRGACRRAFLKARKSLRMEVRGAVPVHTAPDDDRGVAFSETDDRTDELPEEAAIAAEETEAVRRMLADTDPNEFSSWLADFLDGKSERACAEIQGVSQPAIHYRRVHGLARLRERAKAYGIDT